MQSVTRGLVGDSSFAVLPNISPRMTFILTLAAQIVTPALSQPLRPSKNYPSHTARSHQTLPAPNLAQLRRHHDPLRLRLLPLRLARTRKSHPARSHPLQPYRAARPSTPRSLPTPRRRRPRQPVPLALHRARIPRQSRLHALLAGRVPVGVRPSGACVSLFPLSPNNPSHPSLFPFFESMQLS